uniref:Uncharacterized protein n=1 Tax=Sipha flava TaxID=143950 RepID=A0A2S2QK76_9HEMI
MARFIQLGFRPKCRSVDAPTITYVNRVLRNNAYIFREVTVVVVVGDGVSCSTVIQVKYAILQRTCIMSCIRVLCLFVNRWCLFYASRSDCDPNDAANFFNRIVNTSGHNRNGCCNTSFATAQVTEREFFRSVTQAPGAPDSSLKAPPATPRRNPVRRDRIIEHGIKHGS